MPFKTTDPNQPIRLAFLGCGGVTIKHTKTLRGFKNTERHYASRSENKAADFNKKFNGSGHFASYEAAIQSPQIDVVLVATPPDSHLELTLQAVRAGKHVIVEKPPFFRAADFDLVETERQKTGVQVMVAENYFYKPLLQKLKKAIASGDIGDVKFLYFNATKTQNNGDWREEQATAGGGALFEGGIHWVNFISNLGPAVRSVQGFLPYQTSVPMEKSIQVIAEYETGAIGTLLYSWEINALVNGLRLSRIYGTKGSITFESNGVFIFVRGKKWRFVLPGFSDIGGSKAMFRDFFEALGNGKEPKFSFALAKRDLSFIEEIYRTAHKP
ncbi:MAG: Gfo/Idh/MocA family oxidoreductase [Lewinellaceae bacterium]|nr:Gfo/Idh/MocA family oxidoreductase [Saprospiraceae bacterium]MCB9339364.1 Gfo/Idh/MocA family oxidoreductase [Lewinellaceae bacterium]